MKAAENQTYREHHLVERALSPNEERYLQAELLTPQVYAIPWSYRIKGRLDADALAAAIEQVSNRHESLRTGFAANAEGAYKVVIAPRVSPRLECLALPGADAAAVRAAVHAHFYRKPALTPAGLSHYLLIEIAQGDYVFALSQHHAVSDGQSMRLFIEELFTVLAGEALPPAQPFSAFSDAGWRDTAEYGAALTWWTTKLAGIDDVIGIAADIGQAGPPRDDSVTAIMPADLVSAVTTTARRIGVSRFTVLYAACAVLLARMVDRDRVPTTFQSSGRRRFGGAERTIGSFSNALVLVAETPPQRPFADLARAVAADLAGAVLHESVPYQDIIRATGVHPRFGINWFPRLPALAVEGLDIGRADVSDSESDYDLNFRFVPHVDCVELVLFYKASSISQGRARAVIDKLFALTSGFCRDPDAAIGSVHSAAFSAGVIPNVLAPFATPAVAGRIFDAFLAAAAAQPEREAIRYESVSLSYGAVAEASAAVATALAAAGIMPGHRVVVLADRTPALVTTVLGVALRGATFITLDAAYPEQRLRTLFAGSRPDAVINAGDPAHNAMLATLADEVGARIVLPSTDIDPAACDIAIDPAAPAYFLFTSGSTGEPKCIAVAHGPLVHFVGWQSRTYGLGADDRFTMLSGLSHDPLMRDIFTPLSIGATLLIPSQAIILEPGGLYRWFVTEQPSVTHLTPPIGQLLAEGAPDGGLRLRRLFWGGDLLRPELLARIDALAPGACHTNFYGSTETPQAAAHFDVGGERPWRTVPVGRGTQGFQLVILDTRGEQKGIDEAGEIAVRSPFLSLGYVRDGAIVESDQKAGGTAIYRTGDRGFHLPDGNVMLLGRSDDQLKIRGYRVELAEITAAVLRHPAVRTGIALAVGDEGDKRIELFVVDTLPAATRKRELLVFLSDQLPNYMLPQQIHSLDALPLMPNGKVDRRRLVANATMAVAAPATAAGAMSEIESTIAACWSKLLNLTSITRTSTFVEIGGDSLTYVQVMLATEDLVGTLPDDWQFMSIAELAAARTAASGPWRKVDTTMLIRALSIFLVVSAHFKFLPYFAGATTALFLVMGNIFGAFQMRSVFATKRIEPIVRMIVNLLLPVALFSAALYGVKLYVGQHPNPSILLFYGNFFDYSGPDRAGNAYYLWYIHCALQLIVILLLASVLLQVTQYWRIGRHGFALALFVLGCVGRFLLPTLFVPEFFAGDLPLQSMFRFLPSTHLATFALGMLIAEADTADRRWKTLAVVIGYAAASAALYGTLSWVYLFVFGAMLIYLQRVPLPRFAGPPIFLLAGASLFIYLTHFQWRALVLWLPIPQSPALHVFAALVGGIVTWRAWQEVVSRTSRQHAAGVALDDTGI